MNELSRRTVLISGVLLAAGASAALAEDAAAPDAAPAPADMPPASGAGDAPSTVPPSAAPAPPAGQQTPDDAPIGQPPPGLGQVVFFRTSSLIGMPYTFHVHEGGTAYGEVNNAHYFVVNLPPGPHEFRVATEAASLLRLEVEEGETQYVRVTMTMGVMVYRGTLSPSTAEVFQRALGGLHRNPAHPRNA
jgi:hypothetical protein